MISRITRKNDKFIFSLNCDSLKKEILADELAGKLGSTRQQMDWVLSASITGFAEYVVTRVNIKIKAVTKALKFIRNSKNGETLELKGI